ncbi:MAG: ABC transporter permease [Planctomycetota bacterium]|nr:ABC transporter permease [Planctomycetota bacterium]
MSLPRVLAVARTAFSEFWRAPEAVFWTYGFPLLMTVVLGFAFQPSDPTPIPVAVVSGDDAAQLVRVLAENPRMAVEVLDSAEADAALARGRVSLLVSGPLTDPSLRADTVRPEAELARLHAERALRGSSEIWERPRFEPETRPGARYVDFLIPGLIGLNLLGAGMWGIGFKLVEYRSQQLLRRLFATPLSRGEFLAGFLLSRLVLALPESALIALFGILFWDVPFRGSIAAACVFVLCASLAFTGLGILLASRPRTIEGVAGLINACLLPMWLLGGVFFSNDRMDGLLGLAASILPLTWCSDGLRDLMLEPAGFAEVAEPMLWLAGFALACYLAALRVFRWT